MELIIPIRLGLSPNKRNARSPNKKKRDCSLSDFYRRRKKYSSRYCYTCRFIPKNNGSGERNGKTDLLPMNTLWIFVPQENEMPKNRREQNRAKQAAAMRESAYSE